MENIFEYRDYFENEHADLTEFDCLEIKFFAERNLTIDAWQGSLGYICEFLITFGGPTVRLTIDSRYTYGELFHSWGVDHDGNRFTTTGISEEVTNGFKELIESMYAI